MGKASSVKVTEFKQSKIRACLSSEERQKLEADSFWRSQVAPGLFSLAPTLLGDSVWLGQHGKKKNISSLKAPVLGNIQEAYSPPKPGQAKKMHLGF